MLKKILITTVLCISSMNLLTARDFGNATQTADTTYAPKMDQAVQKAEAEVQALLKNATRKDVVPTWASKVELENAITQLEVKKTLVEKFKEAASLQSPQVRDKLLQILNKESIDESDLSELQSIVNQYKETLNNDTKPSPTGITGSSLQFGS